ncbi:putative bifunctional diguanylate cyclase/phosphodiesterase [Desulfosarcina ovata]|uniref:Transcriptional regulator n=1 Tax=Desulfosarcina ovata subsp. ovata TaxID=2752305 RepID=A0A5K8AGH9_9BACT|nr:EAL domain-containing protein [Desulfosarcina ovata]BBO91609.1 transcriptional regulator [Desulfosarcina ovata subsp. ovata]
MISNNKPTYRLLVIDDNPSIHEDFRKILEKPLKSKSDLGELESALFGTEINTPAITQFEIDYASQGKEGVELVERALSEDRPYALAFVDGRMPPGWDGIETISHLWEKCPDLQVVLCTAYADYSWQEIQRELGESDSLLILKKPFDNVEVLQLAHALTRKWELNREIQGRLNQLAFFDNLTGLPNRVLFLDRLDQVLENARRYDHKSALLFIDMDNFKRINDTLGHGIGDDLLRTTAQRLTRCLRASDTVARTMENGIAARLGGDEFTVIMPVLENNEDATLVAQRIEEQLAIPMDLSGHRVTVTPSIGIAIFPKDGENAEALLKNADLAMYFAKRIGRNTFKFYHESMNASLLKRLTIENHLRQAIEKGEFTLHYQPQVELVSGQLSGMEALLRWHNSELGNVPPLEFISVAEENGLILPIGEWVLREACQQATIWIKQGLPLQRMAVNLSVKQLSQPDFIETVQHILIETGLEGHRLELEVTESLLESDPSRFIETLTALKDMNIRIAVDDFGNGYSNMSRMKEMPFDCLKIDRSFINNIGSGSMGRSIVSTIIAMAKTMEKRVIAEGVETTSQVDFLRIQQCHEGQGYLFSHPLSSKHAEDFLRQRQSLSNQRNGTDDVKPFS